MSGKLSFSAIILAGGDSTRMGTDKAFLQLNGEPLIEIVFKKLERLFPEIIIVTDCLRKFEYLPAKVLSDLEQGCKKCSLRGIQAGLTFSSAPASFIIACDMPFISPGLICYLSQFALDFDVVVPRYENYYQPLFAFYNQRALGPINDALLQKDYKITNAYKRLSIKEIKEDALKFFDPGYSSFFNVNSQEDYLKAKLYHGHNRKKGTWG